MRFLLLASLVGSSALMWAQEIKVNPLSQATIYTKIKYNVVDRWQQETGISHTVASLGRWSLSSNLGYTQTYDEVLKDTGWTFGVNLNFKLDAKISVYSKISTSFLGAWRGEHGLRTTLYRGNWFTVSGNAGYVHAIPFRSSDKPSWTVGATFSVPLSAIQAAF